MNETFYKLIAPEYKGLYAKRDTSGGTYIYLHNHWVPSDLTEFFFDEGLFRGEYEIIPKEEAEEALIRYDMTIERCLERAKTLAEEYHKGQKDKGGKPYFQHVEFVASHVEEVEEKIIAYLHDIVEDTPMTLGKLRQHRFPEFIVSHVSLLTRDEEDYFDYVKRLTYFPFARNIKLADLKNNLDASRIKSMTEDDKQRMKKYRKALRMLKE